MNKTFNRFATYLLLIAFLLMLVTGIIKFPEFQKLFSFVYLLIPASKIALIHDFSGLALVILTILHLAIHWRWLKENIANDLRFSDRTKKILFRVLLAIFVILAIYFVKVNLFPSRSVTNLSAVEVRDYQGEKLGSIDDFRENSIKGPQYVEKENYQLEISGMVSESSKLSYDEVLKLPIYQKVVTLNCVEGWSVKALWEGVLVRDLLKDLAINPEAKTIIFYAVDGYSTSFPLSYVMENDIMLASKLNDVTLPPERGFPFQLVAEQKWGYKWIKWITKIELSDDVNYKGFWEKRGYNNNGDFSGPKFEK